MKIVENQKACCRIHIPEHAYPVEQYAAKQLKKYLRKISGVDFTIISGIPEYGPAIVIAEKNHIDLNQPHSMEPESVMRFFDRGRFFLIGGDKRGTLIGIYDFLHKQLGCVFAQSRIEFIPKKETIKISEDFYYHKPLMKMRYMFSAGNLSLIEWCAKTQMSWSVPLHDKKTARLQKENELLSEELEEIWAKQAVELRGEAGLVVGGHVFAAIMPPSRYFNEHPEYFAYDPSQKSNAIQMVKNGRTSYGICWTHPDVKKIFIDYFMDFFNKYPYVKRFTFFPNDGQGPCFCENCRKVEEPWQGITTNQLQFTKNYALFASDIARAVATKFPDVRFEIGSYAGHTELPDDFDTELPENMDVLFCIFERKWDRSFDDPPSEEELKKTIPEALVSTYEKDAKKYTIYPEIFKKWRKHARGMFRYYDYLTSTFGSMGMPFPVSRATLRTIKFLKQLGFDGYGSQWADTEAMWASYGLSMYTTTLSMWDDDATWQQLAYEYCLGVYEESAKAMYEYYETLENAARNVRFGMGIPEILQIFDEKTYATCMEKLKEALDSTKTGRIRKRIKQQTILLKFGHLFWQTRQIEKQIEQSIKENNLDATFLLICKHARIDNKIQKLFNCSFLSCYKTGLLYRHILGSLSDRRGLLYALELIKNATNIKGRNLWYPT